MFKLKAVVVAIALAASAAVSATPLNEYNVILSGNFNATTSGHVEGKAFIGGDLQNGSVFAQKLNNTTTAETLKVVGNINGDTQFHIEAGYGAYGGNLNNVPSNQDWCNGVGINSNADCFRKVTNGSLDAEKTAILNQLASDATFYKGLSTTAGTQITGDNNNKQLAYTGAATDLVVFNLTQADLQSTLSWDLSFGNALNVLVNVSGSVFNANVGQSGNLANANSASHVLWNFYDATNLDFQREWYGSILALNADITTNHNLTGAIAVKSYNGNAEIHNGQWDYTPPVVPPTHVPEPSGILGLLAIAGLLARRMLRR